MKEKGHANKNYCGIPLQQALVCVHVVSGFMISLLLALCVVHRHPYLLVFCESNLEVYNVETSEWTQTISIKKVMIIFILVMLVLLLLLL